jgi:hypothetical protein
MPLQLLKREGGAPKVTVRPEHGDETAKKGPRIRCPRCGWEPERDDRWMCSCLHVWNTFDTGGVCPACARKWEATQCRRCHAWSPHRDWYAAGSGPS